MFYIWILFKASYIFLPVSVRHYAQHYKAIVVTPALQHQTTPIFAFLCSRLYLIQLAAATSHDRFIQYRVNAHIIPTVYKYMARQAYFLSSNSLAVDTVRPLDVRPSGQKTQKLVFIFLW